MATRYRKCKVCKTRCNVLHGIVNGLDFVCCVDHLVDLGFQRVEKQKKLEAKKFKAETRARKRALKTDSQIMDESQRSINAYVRERDRGKACPSCNRPEHEIEVEQGWKVGGAWDAGHFRSRGAAGHLRFNLWNIHRQCKSCNAGSAKYAHKAETVAVQYELNLRERIGNRRVDWLKNNNGIRRFNREYCERIKRIFNRKRRLLQKRRECIA
ncbi:recombination protein NinG [Microbulbifer sp. TRSA001]|uniref:recombination protein NinG n=1 Tax=Microbulbifer sp. TRSA001 TaxID=3243381 RepID=UPI0040392E36